MYNQLSGEVLVACAIRKAISGLSAALALINADKALRVTPNRFAASVTVNPSGLITSSLNTSPGCVGLRLSIMRLSSTLMIITIVNDYHIISLELKRHAPIAVYPYRPGAFLFSLEGMQLIAG